MCIFDAEWLPEQSRCSEAGKTGLRPRSSLLLWAPMEGLSCQTWGASWRLAAGSSWPWRNPVPRRAICPLLRVLLTRGCPASVSASFPPLSVRIACSALRKTKRGWKQTGVGRHGEDQLIMASSSPASSSLSGPARLHARGVGGILVRSGPGSLSQFTAHTLDTSPTATEQKTTFGEAGIHCHGLEGRIVLLFFFLYHFWCNLLLSSGLR